MFEIALGIIVLIIGFKSRKILNIWLADTADQLHTTVLENTVDNQEETHDLSIRIDEIKSKQNGKWVKPADLEAKMK